MNNKQGYIALISVLLISAILLSITLETSYTSFFSRFNTLFTEEKEESLAWAQSCIQVALLRLAENPSYQPSVTGDLFVWEENKCKILSVRGNSATNFTVETTASSGLAVTNLEGNLILTNTSISLKSVKENR